ncbi:MAG: hypothetical protein MUC33_20070 [Desulfobacterales bacterium]|jgi:hypothetical protein|nr:hypothetical protein [Desulfobacterales bacterium]
MAAGIDFDRIAFYEKERKGIFIHAGLLGESPFRPGDRFAVRPRPTQLFSLTIGKDDDGDILFDKHGIFISRTRRIDILMGGIFEKYVICFEPEEPDSIRIRPLDIVLDSSQRWY